jgi:hypothetical protein
VGGRAVTGGRALTRGLRAVLARPRLVVGIWLLHLVLAWGVTWPFFHELSSATALRPYAGALAQGLQLDIMAEIIARRPAVSRAATTGMALGAGCWIFASWFLTAGVLGVLRAAPAELSLRRFAVHAVDRGFAMAGLQLLSVVPYVVALGLLVAGGALGARLGARSADIRWVVAATMAGALPGLGLWLVITTAVDIARAYAVLDRERPLGRVLAQAFRLVAGRLRPAIFVQLGGVVLWLALSGVYLALAWPWRYAASGAFLVLVIVREVLILGRVGVRIAVLGANLALVPALHRERWAGASGAPPMAQGDEPHNT